jgi:hypothetical protein
VQRREERVPSTGRIDLRIARRRSIAQHLGRAVGPDPDQEAALVALRHEQVRARVEQAPQRPQRDIRRDVMAAHTDEIGAGEDR